MLRFVSMKLVGLITFCLLLAGCAGRDASGPANGQQPHATSSGEPLPVGDAEERLEVASRLRGELRSRGAEVVVNGIKLVITYKSASVEEAADDFLKQQGKAGMARIANAGFETLIISARDSTKEIPVAAYRTK